MSGPPKLWALCGPHIWHNCGRDPAHDHQRLRNNLDSARGLTTTTPATTPPKVSSSIYFLFLITFRTIFVCMKKKSKMGDD